MFRNSWWWITKRQEPHLHAKPLEPDVFHEVLAVIEMTARKPAEHCWHDHHEHVSTLTLASSSLAAPRASAVQLTHNWFILKDIIFIHSLHASHNALQPHTGCFVVRSAALRPHSGFIRWLFVIRQRAEQFISRKTAVLSCLLNEMLSLSTHLIFSPLCFNPVPGAWWDCDGFPDFRIAPWTQTVLFFLLLVA